MQELGVNFDVASYTDCRTLLTWLEEYINSSSTQGFKPVLVREYNDRTSSTDLVQASVEGAACDDCASLS